MSKFAKLIIILFVFPFWSCIIADDVCPSKSVSIYSISGGVLVSSHSWLWWYNSNTGYITSVKEKANWYLQFVDGYIAFQNHKYPGYCLMRQYIDDPLALKACDYSQSSQFFKLIPTESGATLIKTKDYDLCLYLRYSEVLTGLCPKSKEVESYWLWSLLPPYEQKVSKFN